MHADNVFVFKLGLRVNIIDGLLGTVEPFARVHISMLAPLVFCTNSLHNLPSFSLQPLYYRVVYPWKHPAVEKLFGDNWMKKCLGTTTKIFYWQRRELKRLNNNKSWCVIARLRRPRADTFLIATLIFSSSKPLKTTPIPPLPSLFFWFWFCLCTKAGS